MAYDDHLRSDRTAAEEQRGPAATNLLADERVHWFDSGQQGPFMCTKAVDQPTCAWAAISSATLCEVPPGKRRSDSINTSTWR